MHSSRDTWHSIDPSTRRYTRCVLLCACVSGTDQTQVMRAACDTYQIEWNDQHFTELIAQVEGPSALVESEDKQARDQSAPRDQEDEHSADEDALMAELNAYQSARSDTRQSAVDTSDLPDVPEPDFDEPEHVPVKKQVSPPTSGPSSTSSRQSTRATANTAVTPVKPSPEEDIDLFASNFPQIPSTKTSPGARSVSGANTANNTNVIEEDEHDLEAKLPRVKTDPRDKKRDSGAGLNDDDLMARFQALKKK